MSTSSLAKYEVPWHDLCWRCNTDDLSFETTSELTPLSSFIGQERAIRAIQFGLEIDKPGYNLFVSGLTGTGKTAVIKSYLNKLIEERKSEGFGFSVFDWCYVHNFVDPDRPRAIRLPAGQARRLEQATADLLKTIREELPKAFASEEFIAQRNSIDEDGRANYQRTMQSLEQEVRAEGFALQLIPSGFNLFPLNSSGSPISQEEFMSMSEEERGAIQEKQARLLPHVQETLEKVRGIEQGTRERIQELTRTIGEARLSSIFQKPLAEFESLPEIVDFLNPLKEHTLTNLQVFVSQGGEPSSPLGDGPFPPNRTNSFLPFEINVFIDNKNTEAAPVIIEPNPTWSNLFGTIERRATLGTYISDYTMLKAGSIHQANGGYLLLNAKDVLTNAGVWDGLKRAIRDKEARLEDPAVQFGLMAPLGLRPQPIPWNATVIVAGDELLYRTLSTQDQEDFWEMFKVKAEFDFQLDLTQEHVNAYCSFIAATCEAEHLRHFDPSGAARVVEYGARLVSDQSKLSTRFGQIKDVLIEADYWARKDGSEVVNGNHVKKALDEKLFRLNLVEERIRELMTEGMLMIDVTGKVVGQVNGLSVYDLGDFSFGRPSRITAKTFAGRQGVINIEREAQLSGRIHDKGVLILSGYLGWKFAQDTPLSLTASLSFEQSYEGVEGDSASSTEVYAILSSLADLPIAQSIAVTGSVNQKGEIQPIGGVNQKVEGFFDLCRIQGLTGEQGVMVPHQNVRNLMVRDDIVDAVHEGRFHVYAIKTIDEGIEVLSGVPMGARLADKGYPQGTVAYLVDERLRELASSLRGYYAEMLNDGPRS